MKAIHKIRSDPILSTLLTLKATLSVDCKRSSYQQQNIAYLLYQYISMSQMQRFRQQSKPSAARIMAVSRHRKTLTEQQSVDSCQQQVSTGRDVSLLAKMQKSTEFPSIFYIHKKEQYSGYKQVGLIKNHPIRQNQQARQGNKYQTPRNLEINTKNIAKLRKRFSLDPIQLKDFRDEHQRMFMATSKSLQKQRASTVKDSQTERHYHKQLMEMLRLMTHNHRSASGKTITNNSKTTDSLEQSPQNLSRAFNQSQDEKSDLRSTNEGENAESPKTQKAVCFNKPYYVQIKKRIENKLHKTTKKKVLPSIGKLVPNDEEQALCGWTAKSFYPKNRSQFFEGSHDERSRLIQGQN